MPEAGAPVLGEEAVSISRLKPPHPAWAGRENKNRVKRGLMFVQPGF